MKRPRYADVAATLAMVLALGGTSYAVTALPRDSVGTAQIKAHAVTKGEAGAERQDDGPRRAARQGGSGRAHGPDRPHRRRRCDRIARPRGAGRRAARPAAHPPRHGSGHWSRPGAQFLNIAAPCPADAINLGRRLHHLGRRPRLEQHRLRLPAGLADHRRQPGRQHRDGAGVRRLPERLITRARGGAG